MSLPQQEERGTGWQENNAGVVGKEDKNEWFLQLSSWIEGHGGYVHPSLDVRQEKGGDRGIFATKRVEKGSLLVRLPGSCALSGEGMPDKYKVEASLPGSTTSRKRPRATLSAARDAPPYETDATRPASPWLRCIAALLLARKRNARSENDENSMDFAAYFASLPPCFDTLLSWSDHEVTTFLAGTSLGSIAMDDRRQGILPLRYEKSVLPYLYHVTTALHAAQPDTKPSASAPHSTEASLHGDDDDDGISEFYFACECLSSRGFHMNLDHAVTHPSVKGGATAHYDGPYILPFVDLLNHTNDPCRKVTTLHRDPSNSAFFMKADRAIEAGEELLHSYGGGGTRDEEDGRTSEQFLRTFGFVEEGIMRNRASGTKSEILDGPRTPALLSKTLLMVACQSVANSDYPKQLKIRLESMDTGDEVWDLPLTDVMQNQRHASEVVMGEDLVVAGDSSTVLSDSIVTTCVVPFLPEDAFAEWRCAPALLDSSVLEDLYLGKLVVRALLQAIDTKLGEYKPITFGQNVGQKDDELLAFLLRKYSLDAKASDKNESELKQMRHAMYGLTVRLEEKENLQSLRLEVLRLMDGLETANED